MLEITKNTARSLVIEHQLPAPRKGETGTLAAIEQLGYVQIDTISVVARAHHHVLWTRVPNYQPKFLQTLVEEDKKVYDYWAHAASFLPMKDYRFSLYRKWEKRQKDKHWYTKNPQMMAFVLDQIRERGAMMSKDFEKGNWEKTHAWGVPPVKQALMHLFMDGQIMIVGRKGFQKIYDLPENFLPTEVDTTVPTRTEYIEHIIRRDIGAHGLISTKSMGHLLKISIAEKQAIIDQLVQTDELTPVRIKGIPFITYYAFTKKIEGYTPKKRAKKLHLLSPFDNLVILRKRVEQLFDFSYTLECYVTAKKRKVGYFSLPILYGKEFIGQIDLKADRKTKVLWVKNLVWEKKFNPTDAFLSAFTKKMKAFANFNDCEEINASTSDEFSNNLLVEMFKL
ncbi:MAG: crosslink repair DNA glycosylase YcaQ family protein [Bacteroidota bacterium]